MPVTTRQLEFASLHSAW